MLWQPAIILTQENRPRRVGVELEFAGVPRAQICTCIEQQFGGRTTNDTQFEAIVQNTELGDFTVELDSQYFKELAQYLKEDESIQSLPKEIDPHALITKAAEQFVPWEVVSPPIEIAQLPRLSSLIEALRKAGALGTRYAVRYAFGVHLNPELPNLQADTVLNYLRSFMCLYEWIVYVEKIDLVRKLTTYINHYDKKYIEKVLHPNYQPDMSTLIDDYIDFNPTRNRTLDLLPLFAFIDEPRVRARLGDPRIKARPTFHFRLPNCDIDNPNWNIDISWRLWLAIEYLANNPAELASLSAEYLDDLQRFSRTFDDRWLSTLQSFISEKCNPMLSYANV